MITKREFIKKGSLWLTGAAAFDIFTPKLIRAQLSPFDPIIAAQQNPPASGFYTTGLLAWWKLNGDGTDSSGNGNNLTLVGSPSFGTGKNFAQALVLNGSSQYATAGNFADFPTNQTMMAWVKTSSATNFQCILSKLSAGGSGSGQGMCMNIENPLFSQLGFINFIQNNSGSDWTGTSTNGSITANDGVFHHSCMVISSQYTVTSYHNGSVANVVPYDDNAISTTYTNTNGWMVGNSTGSEFWNGTIADVRIYNAALSPAIIAAIAAGNA